ncbi:major allergen Pyr c 1-like isoform X2 [Pistacia vera]|uniref:major allergen Pyr c 1-like isoform X2 n=1 Tax=Pistacia vera TaxID=55513 RepID=UPI001263440F|nr:major allergen Pyr c 1-like isoform X2 [Pistacia vera]
MCNFLYMILSVDPPCKLMLISVKPLLTNSHCSGMMKEVKSQVKAGVEIGTFWKALTKDMRFIIPKIVPNLVKEVELVEGDGGLGSVLLFKFGSAAALAFASLRKGLIVSNSFCMLLNPCFALLNNLFLDKEGSQEPTVSTAKFTAASAISHFH